MILGMTLYTFIHVIISLIGIATGLIVVIGMLFSKRLDALTAIFLTTTLATNITGFFFPFHGFKPSYGVGALSTILLIVAIVARYRHALQGRWNMLYIITAIIALYLNVFVLIIQSFEKIPALHAMAPTQSEAPFKDTQTLTIFIFIILGLAAVRITRTKPLY
jgi:hypothetical protein